MGNVIVKSMHKLTSYLNSLSINLMTCEHLDRLSTETIIPKANYPVFHCEECIRINGRWVHLRICQTCGKLLCCDSSKHQHARHHAHETGHAVISSAELGEQWLWCFVHEQAKNY